jgi:hypothetical protein
MKMLDLVANEYFAITEYIKTKYPVESNRIIIDSKRFYSLLDKNLYITRAEKLGIYKSLNLIICNSNGLTSVVYDKETKTTKRKIIINYEAYETLKKIYTTELN